jgi:iron-sulfur cluster assembly accessory protein
VQMLLLTDNAVNKVKQLLATEKKEGHGLRVAVKGGGCSGFEYAMTFESDPRETDHVLEFGDLRVFVDGMSNVYLESVTIDYLDGLQGAGFKIENPKATGSCGCGHSFSM